jgi:hypothetical protein
MTDTDICTFLREPPNQVSDQPARLFRAVEIVDGESVEPAQFVGVYVLHWPSDLLGAPTIGFVEVEDE